MEHELRSFPWSPGLTILAVLQGLNKTSLPSRRQPAVAATFSRKQRLTVCALDLARGTEDDLVGQPPAGLRRTFIRVQAEEVPLFAPVAPLPDEPFPASRLCNRKPDASRRLLRPWLAFREADLLQDAALVVEDAPAARDGNRATACGDSLDKPTVFHKRFLRLAQMRRAPSQPWLRCLGSRYLTKTILSSPGA